MLNRIRQLRNVVQSFDRRFNALACLFEGKSHGDFRPAPVLRRRKQWSHVAYYLFFALLAACILELPDSPSSQLPRFAVGEIATEDVLASTTGEIELHSYSKSHRDEISRRVPPVYDYNDALVAGWMRSWDGAFQAARRELKDLAKAPYATKLDQLGKTLQEHTHQSLLSNDLLFLMQHGFSEDYQQLFHALVDPLQSRLISSQDLFAPHYATGILIRQINQSLNETLLNDVSRIWSLEHTREYLKKVALALPDQKSDAPMRVAGMISYLLAPNLTFNGSVTQQRVAQALGRTRSQWMWVTSGQVIVRKGDRISDQQVELIQEIARLDSWPSRAKRVVLKTLFLFCIFAVGFRTKLTRRNLWRLSLKDSIFFLSFALCNLVCIKFALPFLRHFFSSFGIKYGIEYAIPVASGAIVIHLILGKEAAYTFAVTLAVSVGLLLDRSWHFSVWLMTVSAAAIQSLRSCKQRNDLYRAGAWSGTVGSVLVATFSMWSTLGHLHTDWGMILGSGLLSLISGIGSAIITISLIPIIESALGYTTNLKLLELSNFNHPLLHALMMKAPGTYHHSMIVGTLAEIAADRIKANPLLARVSAYYHDIGKMGKPLYFIENQPPNHNPHDQISPVMSAKILFSHVKNGVRLGREHNLGDAINHIIEQHHGTTLVSYFFNKAKQLEEGDSPVPENEFRYPGPKPQSREAAIVMIADACEAATRSINEPTAAKIESMVRNIVNKRFLDQQFIDCDLTFHDLQMIEQCFVRTLTSLYHHRIEYPNQNSDLAHAKDVIINTKKSSV